MDVRVKFFGGAQSVTGSKYLLEIDDYTLLVDCGLFQGLKPLRLRNWDAPAFEVSKIDAVLLTHAHIDHSGYLPKLFNLGFRGPVFCTTPTADLLEIMLMDSAKLQEEEALYAKKKGYSKHENPEPLYTQKDVELCLPYIYGVAFHHTFEIKPGIQIHFAMAGHILGAAILSLTITGDHQTKKIVFSGDLGRKDDPLMFPPEPVLDADVLFVESTYGGRAVPELNPIPKMARIINETFAAKGCVLIPAFSVGRTQNILYYIKEMLEDGLIAPELEIYVDSPMAIAATKLYQKHMDAHKITYEQLTTEDGFVTLRKNMVMVQSHEASKYLNQKKSNAIIISASGMMTGGRIMHHLFNRLPNEQDTVIVVGYQAEGTRGRRIVDGETAIKIMGQMVSVKARVEQIDGLSAHADQTELLFWLKHFQDKPKFTFLVHGEPDGLLAFQSVIKTELGWDAIIPAYLESFVLFKGI